MKPDIKLKFAILFFLPQFENIDQIIETISDDIYRSEPVLTVARDVFSEKISIIIYSLLHSMTKWRSSIVATLDTDLY